VPVSFATKLKAGDRTEENGAGPVAPPDGGVLSASFGSRRSSLSRTRASFALRWIAVGSPGDFPFAALACSSRPRTTAVCSVPVFATIVAPRRTFTTVRPRRTETEKRFPVDEASAAAGAGPRPRSPSVIVCPAVRICLLRAAAFALHETPPCPPVRKRTRGLRGGRTWIYEFGSTRQVTPPFWRQRLASPDPSVWIHAPRRSRASFPFGSRPPTVSLYLSCSALPGVHATAACRGAARGVGGTTEIAPAARSATRKKALAVTSPGRCARPGSSSAEPPRAFGG
jgi:hypothetical protein